MNNYESLPLGLIGKLCRTQREYVFLSCCWHNIYIKKKKMEDGKKSFDISVLKWRCVHSTEEHCKCGVRPYRGLKVLKNMDVSNMILIFY